MLSHDIMIYNYNYNCIVLFIVILYPQISENTMYFFV